MPELSLPISDATLKLLFTEARSFSNWLPKDVPNEMLHRLYDLMKFGPTSMNSCPARLIFVKSQAAKDKLIDCVSPFNVEKVRTAPVTTIIALDSKFYNQIPKLFPHAPTAGEIFESDQNLGETTAFRSGTLQGAYLILAARSIGLDCGPMSGFDNAKMDEAFLKGTSWKSNFICSLGFGDRSKLHPRLPRFEFDEACKIV